MPRQAAAAATAAGDGDEVRLENEHASLHIWLKGPASPTHHHHHQYDDHHHAGGPRFSFVSKANPELGIFDTSLVEFNGRIRGKPWRATLANAAVRVEETELASTDCLREFGPKAITVAAELPEVGHVFLDFALSSTGPRMILRLRCPSVASKDEDELRLEEFVLFDGDCEVSRGPRKPGGGRSLAKAVWDFFFFRPRRGSRRVFVNGWNAWSFTGAVQQGDRPSSPGLPAVFSAAFHHGAGSAAFDRGTKELYSEMFALLSDEGRGTGLLLGFLSQHEQFGAFSFDPTFVEVGAHCRCDGQNLKAGAALTSDWCLIELQPALPEEPLSGFMDRAAAVSRDLVAQQDAEPVGADTERVPVGWCSWYHFYENISEKNLQDNITMMASLRDQLPLQLFQIDDGYQRAWGDWLTLDSAKFPTKSMRDLVELVRAQGLRPGLWLAPVAVDKHSRVAAEHPEWIIRQAGDPLGRAANSANCGKWFYGLDVTIPEVQAFVRETLTTVSHGAWSFDYLKLDFLYAAALKGPRRDATLSTAQVLQLAMRLIRHAVGKDTFVLGCGAPLGATIGWVNANRVSADAGPAWLPSFPLPDCKWNLPCGRNMVRNTINRLCMHGRWWVNDPDCMLLREATQFTPAEVIAIATVKALSGGSFLLSDDLGSVSRARLRVAQALLPVSGRAAVALDLLEKEMPEVLRLALSQSEGKGPDGDAGAAGWVLVALCNWTDSRKETAHPWVALLRPLLASRRPHPQPLALHVLEFWSSEYFHVRLDLDATPDAAMDTRHLRPAGDALGEAGAGAGAGGMPPHSARLYAVRIDQGGGQPQYLGADVHFSCGLELRRLEWEEEEAEAEAERAAAATDKSTSGGGAARASRHKRKRRMMAVRLAVDAGKVVEGGLHHVWLQLPGSQRALELQGAPAPAGATRLAVDAITYELQQHGLPHLPRLGGDSGGGSTGAGRRGKGLEEEAETRVRTVWKVPFSSQTARTFEWTLRYELD